MLGVALNRRSASGSTHLEKSGDHTPPLATSFGG